jgi:hypothetical protein
MSKPDARVAAGDVAVLVAFGLIGLASHERELTLVAFARAVLPFPVAWLVVGAAAGVLRMRVPLGRLAIAWLAAGLLALVGRSIVFDRELFTAFFVIALVGNGLFLIGWRLLLKMLMKRAGGESPGGRPAYGEG